MKINLPLLQEQKLTIIFRIEPGCLGPNGVNHIEAFCELAEKEFASIDSDFIHWTIIPRLDKSLPEMQYKINNKKLAQDKAEKYLKVFGKSLHEFEDHLHNKIGLIIDQFMGY
ncbi:MAG: hypothetical protein KZQ64_03165 [gamma proteobacterium symbiont of Bathyaustriella thionipta]|nr:hypothetical protein [gamma proteobacterium symbiont of Bathyaustriella thionipta]MCU7948882.1 hypothetical protein [gamma proteobacterium symbiont of Bathyaustriella thionipta]MCU7952384.1 hypothetical protein [gamma proteobacterium symbiont of Bathyaustriella thionipta]MCU7955339.1 hypothetical protein [gamma proteobacterium symbiont of Bathyaustriella thionipta]MCU7966113.1 hypothetical protein [gamma proteobacterium symbiont of Bathyaustriella thionipta]